MDSRELLTGGNSNRVQKDGNSVLRQTGKWSPFVHQLLQFLTEAGFQESPVLLEQQGDTERLSFIKGEVGLYPLKPYMQTDAMLVEAATLLRRLHDLTQNFVPPADAVFQLPVRAKAPYEVICHNDFAPYNCVFESGHLAGVIDFDTAGPGTRLWDVAYAAYRFVPLTNDRHSRDCGWQPIPNRSARLRLFCDAYGLHRREPVIPSVKERLEALVDYMQKTASNLEHIPIYIEDLKYIAAHEQTFTEALR